MTSVCLYPICLESPVHVCCALSHVTVFPSPDAVAGRCGAATTSFTRRWPTPAAAGCSSTSSPCSDRATTKPGAAASPCGPRRAVSSLRESCLVCCASARIRIPFYTCKVKQQRSLDRAVTCFISAASPLPLVGAAFKGTVLSGWQ